MFAILRAPLVQTALLGLPLLVTSCANSIPLQQAVIAYDDTASRVGTEQLLLNLARVRNHRPVHFTTISSVSATYTLGASIGFTPPLGGTESGIHLSPLFGGSVEENPTITLIPVEGEEYNERVLSPMSEVQFGMMLQEGTDIALLLCLMGAAYRIDDRNANDRILRNRPSRKAEYEEYRRRVMHLAALYEQNLLFADTVVIDQTVEIRGYEGEQAGTVLEALENGYRWDTQEGKGVLSRKLPGRLVLTNYDLDQLTREQRRSLYQEAAGLDSNEILVDVRSTGPGGDFPMHGSFRLRGFLGILNFVGRGIDEEPEFAVAPDPRTAPLRANPDRTLDVLVTESRLKDAHTWTQYEGSTYSIVGANTPAGIWNLEAFRLLGQLYELSVHPSEFSRPAPTITIGK